MNTDLSKRERVLGGLWGSIVGDALGVPVEFRDRETIRANPVTDMRGHGTHNQPAGTWSDDSSLLLCSTDSLVQHAFDTEDMGQRFLRWYAEELWTPHGRVFDIGNTTARALGRLRTGTRAEMAGGSDLSSNGNGSLMRILPVCLRFADQPTKVLLDRVHRASAITHRHPRSQMSCGWLALVVRELVIGANPADAFQKARTGFREFYESDPAWSHEIDAFRMLLAVDFATASEAEIGSSGYVVHTLTASLWCLLTTRSFKECVLKAVNLGEDTDTTGCVAGGLAGLHYGPESIPPAWLGSIARHDEVEALFKQFAEILSPAT